jgi:hypothetical protein
MCLRLLNEASLHATELKSDEFTVYQFGGSEFSIYRTTRPKLGTDSEQDWTFHSHGEYIAAMWQF